MAHCNVLKHFLCIFFKEINNLRYFMSVFNNFELIPVMCEKLETSFIFLHLNIYYFSTIY